MEQVSLKKAQTLLQQAKKITFLTGAGVSTPSGIPDYRSLNGVYQGLDTPEYLLSVTCFKKEPEKFYQFIKQLYHLKAQPNVIHEKIAAYTKTGACLVTQNIDGLHQGAGTENMVAFHGNLSEISCETCGEKVTPETYLKSNRHKNCGGFLRPAIILYEQALPLEVILKAQEYVAQADLLVVVGTSLKVYPFAGLLQAKNPQAKILVVNQVDPGVVGDDYLYLGPAETLFATL